MVDAMPAKAAVVVAVPRAVKIPVVSLLCLLLRNHLPARGLLGFGRVALCCCLAGCRTHSSCCSVVL